MTAITAQRALLLDLDGTLVDSRLDIAAASNAARVALGFSEQSLEQICGYIGNGLTKLLERLFPDLEADAFAEAQRQFQLYYRDHCCDQTELYAGISEVLHTFHRAGWKLAVVSNKPTEFCKSIIATTDIEALIDFIIGGDDFKKPQPEQLFAACTALAVEPSNAWMVGDHDTDIGAAAAAGMPSAWASWGIGHHHGMAFDTQLDRPSDLLSVLEG